MSGLIQQIINIGLERRELAREFTQAEVGPGRIPYEPKSLASLVTLLKPRVPKSYLCIEANHAGADFLYAKLSLQPPEFVPAAEKELRKTLRTAPKPYDLISIDPRGLPLAPDELWKYLLGGKGPEPTEFGKGAPRDYGSPLIRTDSCVIVHRSTPKANDLWFALRARYMRLFQSDTVGMVRI